jgi:uncharacterized membrane protein
MDMAEEPGVVLQTDLRALRHRSLERTLRSAVVTRRVVYTGAAAYALLFVAAGVFHYLSFHAVFTDLGGMAQAVWSTAHGHFLEATSFTGEQRPRLGGHVDPFLALLVPLWWAWSSPLMLLVFQALAVSTGALPVYWLARKHLRSERAAAHFAFAYLLYPATQFNALTITSGFHSVSVAVPLILFAIWFLDEEKLLLFLLFAVLAATTKEEIPVAVGCLGIWFAVRTGRRLVGLGIFGAGLAVTVIDFLVIIPHYSASGVDPFVSRYSQVGTTPVGILKNAFTDPGAILHAVATGHKLLYVILLLGPFLGLWLRAPLVFLGAVPDLAINLLSAKGDQTVIAYHWTAGIVPFTVAASILGAARLKRDHDRLSLYVLVGAACFAVVSPITLGIARGDISGALTSNHTRAVKAHALGLIPDGAPVAASNQLATYLSGRRYIYIYPLHTRKALWMAIDRNDNTYSDSEGYRRAVHELDANIGREWSLIYRSHGIEVLRRRSAG